MQKIIKVGDTVIAVLSNGDSYQKENLSDEEFNKLCKATSDEEVIAIMDAEYGSKVSEIVENKKVIEGATKSNILTFKGDAVYWEEVSGLSMPKELVQAVLEAEKDNDEIRIETYRNFWTLMSLNPDEQCRLNLFWFLNKNGLVISRCGFFVAYRNVDFHVDYTEDNPIYTDNYTKKFVIRIGEVVTMNRKDCDNRQDVTCSSGLHLGARTWLKHNYCGRQGLVCLCNPAEVVAVPHEDHYGKLRTCAYLPIAKAEFDSNGDVIPYDAKDGFECMYVPKVIYEGLMGTEEDTNYKIEIPDMPGINRESIADKLLDIAREAIINREG